MNGYHLSRKYFAFKFENPNKLKSNHTELYFYIIDLWNRLGQKENFGLPTAITMECLGVASYNSYKKYLNDLIDFGFIKLVSDSKNQHQSKIIALSFFDKAHDKALDKATIKAHDKALDKAHDKALDSIDKQINNITIEQINNKIENNFIKENNKNDLFFNDLINSESWLDSVAINYPKSPKFTILEVKDKLLFFKNDCENKFLVKNNKKEFAQHFINWFNLQTKIEINKKSDYGSTFKRNLIN
jgi:hypothetical protein